jgi:hypothetical protein
MVGRLRGEGPSGEDNWPRAQEVKFSKVAWEAMCGPEQPDRCPRTWSCPRHRSLVGVGKAALLPSNLPSIATCTSMSFKRPFKGFAFPVEWPVDFVCPPPPF